MKHTDRRGKKILIVGQGIAGTMLAWKLAQRGISFTIVSEKLKNTCSFLAAGLINPVTGRKYVKSWMTDELYGEVEKTYSNIESFIGHKILHQISFLRDFANPGDENAWMSRCQDPDYSTYIKWIEGFDIQHTQFDSSSIFGLTKGYRIDTHVLLTLLRNKWLESDSLIDQKFDIEEVLVQDNIHFNDIEYDHIVFCTGAHDSGVDYFDQLPLIPNAGEFIIVRIKDLDTQYFLKRHKVLVPLGNNEYWFGATYDWDCKSIVPTDQGKGKLIEALEAFISCPYEILEHHLGVRPTVKDRRPLLGTHNKMQNVHLFNGFGTKGYSLTPYWANHLIDHIVDGKELNKEVDLGRF